MITEKNTEEATEKNTEEATEKNTEKLKSLRQRLQTLNSMKIRGVYNLNDRVELITEIKRISDQLSNPNIITKESQKKISTPIKEIPTEKDRLISQIQEIKTSISKARGEERKQLVKELNAKKGELGMLVFPPDSPPIKDVKFDEPTKPYSTDYIANNIKNLGKSESKLKSKSKRIPTTKPKKPKRQQKDFVAAYIEKFRESKQNPQKSIRNPQKSIRPRGGRRYSIRKKQRKTKKNYSRRFKINK